MIINPYHYPVIDNRLEITSIEDLESMLTGEMEYPDYDTLLVKYSKVLDMILPHLGLSYGNSEIKDYSSLLNAQSKNKIRRAREIGNDESYYDQYHFPEKLTEILLSISTAKPKKPNWSRFVETYLKLNEDEADFVGRIFEIMFNVKINTLFDKPRCLWEIPEKISELNNLCHSGGIDFIEIKKGVWQRVDIAVRSFNVTLIKDVGVVDDEDYSTRYYRKNSIIGCAATIEGAIEIASKIIPQLKAEYVVNHEGVPSRVSDECLELQVKDRKGEVLLKARLYEPDIQALNQHYTVNYEAEWIEPIPADSLESVEEEIKSLIGQAGFESSWDNYATAQGLRRSAERLKEQLPSKNYDSYELQRILRQTLSKVGDSKQVRNLLEMDLSL